MMNIELMRAKMKEKERLNTNIQIDDQKNYENRIKTALLGAQSKYTVFNTKFTIGFYSLIVPYVLGFIVITVLCLSLVDISLDAYLSILSESFSLTGLWTIGYFLLSVLVFIYLSGRYFLNR